MAPLRAVDRIALAAGLAIAAVWLAILCRVWFFPNQQGFAVAMNLAIATAVTGGLAILVLPRRRAGGSPSPATVAGLAIAIAVLCGGLIWLFGHRHIGGFDHSVLVDLAWRLASGQQAFVDFPSTLPVGFVLGAGCAFSLFGVSWSSLIGWQALFAACTFLWSFVLLWRISRRALFSLLLAFALQCGANVLISYWWYNSATSTAAALFFLSAAGFWREPRSGWFAASYTGSLCLLAAMKPNIAGVLIAGVTVTLLCSREHRARVVIFSAVALLLFLGLLASGGLGLAEVCGGYLSVSGRGFSLQQFLQDLTVGEKRIALAMAAAVGLPWILHFRRRPAWRDGWALAGAGALAGAYGFLSNGEIKFVDLLLPVLALWWLQEGSPRPVPVARRWFDQEKYVTALAAVLVVAGLTLGALRARVRSIGPGVFFSYEVASAPLQTSFFSRVEGGPELLKAEAMIAQVLREEQPGRVFFGPRIQWAYAAFNQESPRHEPVWWHPGVSYAPADEQRMVRTWMEARHDVLIFLESDRTKLPTSLLAAMEAHYVRLADRPLLTVYRSLARPH